MLVSSLASIERAADAAGHTLDGHQVAAARRLAATTVGAYVHGPAGRGKTWLVGSHFDALPSDAKRRVHFHGFFGELHRAIFRHGHDTDAAIDELLGDLDVLYFDEFHVHDSGDAVLLTRLLGRVFSSGVRLLITSNYAPRGLLPNPVFHPMIEPAIALIEHNLEVIEVDGGRDYRHDADSRDRFARGAWLTGPLELPAPSESVVLTAAGHRFSARAVRGSQVWFAFAELCEAPTSVNDFVEWAERFDDWVVDGVPPLASASLGARARFGNLVDVLADRGHRLTVVALVDRNEFAADAGGLPDIGRTLSRLALLRQGSPG
ncbi:cell division protein ZapE [Diaminobutyricimonas sp. LJ205]|uniref:cell division protein ZapE n=1 Tax=Diaminobutyricimonas sp. LJ205 TaxID=2683590 RepID=UPI0012F4ABC4|nr:cell division protein ZapE [Diaminobutyricimonas sp. LJ205]